MKKFEKYPPTSGFYCLPNVFFGKLSTSEHLVCSFIFSKRGVDEHYEFSKYRVGKDLGIARATVEKCLHILHEKGVLTNPAYPFRLTGQFSAVEGNFTKVPYIFGMLDKREHLVYCYIASKITIPDYNFANARIAKEIKIGQKPVKLALQSLEQKGFLIRKRIIGSRRFTYALFYPSIEYRMSLFEKSKSRKATEIILYFQIYLEEHDKNFKPADCHIPLKDETIKKYCELIHEGSIEQWTAATYREACRRFLKSDHSGDFHFPIFARSIVDSVLVFDGNGNADLNT